MIRTRVGYAGGRKQHPSYHDLGDHSETLQVDYDPERISYEQLLNVFWQSHRPASPPHSRQYMSAVFFHDEEQKRLALESKEQQANKLGTPLYTEILQAGEFTLAEEYHQKYLLQLLPEILREFQRMYPQAEGWIASTAAARVNGYLGGHGSLATLDSELSDLGLSPEASEQLRSIAARHSS